MKKNKRVLLLTPYPFDVAPSQRLKFEQYYPSFEAAGFKLTKSAFISDHFWKVIYTKGNYGAKIFFTVVGYLRRIADLVRIPFFDVVYVHLWVTPFGPPFFEWLVRRLSKKLVYDIDDMIYLQQNKSKANPIISNLKGKNKPIYLFQHADHVITCTTFLEAFAKKYNSKVTNIPVSVDTSIYTPKNNYAVRRAKIVLGWSGSMSTSPYMHLLDEVLQEVRKDHDFKLLILGDDSFTIKGVEVEAWCWDKAYEMQTLRRFDIGLYPLPDEPWVYGKGGGKALQYMSLGIPTVATAIGANFDIIKSGNNGFLVKQKEEWISVLKQLIVDVSLRERIGRAGVETIEQTYSVNANKKLYLDILNN